MGVDNLTLQILLAGGIPQKALGNQEYEIATEILPPNGASVLIISFVAGSALVGGEKEIESYLTVGFSAGFYIIAQNTRNVFFGNEADFKNMLISAGETLLNYRIYFTWF
jgi:hypothetical protein